MARFEITHGELIQSDEPEELPGAFIIRRHRVIDSTGAVPSEQINWSGPGEWIESRDGVPDGHIALWLGKRDVARPLIVFVVREATAASADYARGYRRAFSARRRPEARASMPQAEIDGLMDGWRDRKARVS